MLNQSLRRLDFKLIGIISRKMAFSKSADLLEFYKLIVSLHSNIKEYLRHQFSTPNSRLTADQSDESATKSVPFAIHHTMHNQEEMPYSSFQPREPKSLNDDQPSKTSELRRIKLAQSSSSDKNFQDLMEKIKVIILYQNKVEKQLLSINNSEKMIQVCTDDKPLRLANFGMDNKENQANLLDIEAFKDDIKKVFDECKNIQEVHDNFKQFQANQSVRSLKSQNQSHDKKSLLTQMLRQSQIIENEHEEGMNKRVGKRPISEADYLIGKKQLQKQINFSAYRIEGGYPRKERRDRAKNCGQCSECTIF